jgi:membrane-associated protein
VAAFRFAYGLPMTHFWELVARFGYAGLFLGTAVEGTGLPGPVELLFLTAGVMVARGRLDFWLVWLTAAVGNTVGNLFGYALGYYGGRSFVRRFGPYVGVEAAHLRLIGRWFRRYGGVTLVISRLIGVTRTPAILGAGVGGMPMVAYVGFSFLADLLWSLLWTYVGTFAGRAWDRWRQHHPGLVAVLAATATVSILLIVLAAHLTRTWLAGRKNR